MRLTTATTILLASTAIAWAADVGTLELPKMNKTFEANPARFAHDYVGKSFASSATVTDIVQRTTGDKGPVYSVTLDSNIVCPSVSVDDAQSFNKGDTVNLTGTVAAYSPQAMELGQCTFSRSVPVEEPAAGPAPESRLAPAPAPVAMADPKIIYLPAPPAPQVIYVQPQNTTQEPSVAPTEQEAPIQPQSSVQPPQPPLIRKDRYQGGTPRALNMACAQADGGPSYRVIFDPRSNVVRVFGHDQVPYTVYDRKDIGTILYVAAKRPHNGPAMWFAFDHSQSDDASATLIKTPGGQDIRDKCQMDWQAVDNG